MLLSLLLEFLTRLFASDFVSDKLLSIPDSLYPQITGSNTLNPVLLALATRAHWIQAHVLHIPDRYGFFSPSPPRLQVWQAFLFLKIFTMVICSIPLGASILYHASSRPNHKPLSIIALCLAMPAAGAIAFLWVSECYNGGPRGNDW